MVGHVEEVWKEYEVRSVNCEMWCLLLVLGQMCQDPEFKTMVLLSTGGNTRIANPSKL